MHMYLPLKPACDTRQTSVPACFHLQVAQESLQDISLDVQLATQLLAGQHPVRAGPWCLFIAHLQPDQLERARVSPLRTQMQCVRICKAILARQLTQHAVASL